MTKFEQATLETLVSFKASKPEQISQLLASEKLKKEACDLVKKWNLERKKLCLAPWK